MQAAGARRLQRARRGQEVSSAHALPRAPPSHFRLRSIGTDPTDCLLLSGAPRTTPFDFSRLLGAVSRRGGLHVEGCSVGLRGRIFTREARGWGGWSGQDRSGGAAHLILSRFRHHFSSVAGCLHRLPGIAYCLTTSSCVCVTVSSVCVCLVRCLCRKLRARVAVCEC